MKFSPFTKVSESIKGEREKRQQDYPRILQYGISYLDKVFGGIWPADLILLGGRSGEGKSELATHIALHNSAIKNKKVYYFALEAENLEIESRMLYKILTRKYFSDTHYQFNDINYTNWQLGKLDQCFERYYDSAVEEMKAFENLYLRYRGETFGLEELERDLTSIKDDADLIIIDHLHYIEHQDPNENKAFKNIVKKIHSIVLENRKPIILVGHVRKSDSKFRKLIPEQEDFHGSSDIFKEATKIITVAPAFGIKQNDKEVAKYKWPTYLKACKLRAEGSRTRFVAIQAFNSRINAYEEKFLVGKLNPTGDEWMQLDLGEIPEWAKQNEV